MAVVAMAQNAGIILSYNKGKELKFYTSDELNKAINDAEVNDTVYFGPGTFSLANLPKYDTSYENNRQINKPLTFIGSGAHAGGTFIEGNYDIYLTVDISLDESKKIYNFEGLRFEINQNSGAGMVPYSNIKELNLKNVMLYRFVDMFSNVELDETYSIDNLNIDRCYLSGLYIIDFLTKHVNVNNTKMNNMYGGCDSDYGVATLDHCYIGNIGDNTVGLIQHSLIYNTSADERTSIEDCWLYGNDGSANMTECRELSDSKVSDLDNAPSSLGKCKDGTAYGTTGGIRPYTLYPQYPTPDTSVDSDTGKSRSYVDYDVLNKKLTITVKRLGE